MNSKLSDDGSTLTLRIGERFDFSLHREFRAGYEEHPLRNKHIVVDLSLTRTMDSSALGMLLVLRERAGGDSANITLVNPGQAISQVLAVSRFEQLFKIA